ncbi:uncharacterized protein G2W53_041859 [Senna tora]|uniref:Uncharacterized protein n=1 Tax=Senna tora TaxID=362788 RepID=A0A834SFG3_9FABA|nr:uncharacterized protein G2W53_041859 [Senna tora]
MEICVNRDEGETRVWVLDYWKIGFQLKHPIAVDPNSSRKLVTSDETIVDTVKGCGVDNINMIDFANKNHEFLSSLYMSRQYFSATTELGEENHSIKCKKGGTLLV